jgi:hypothetical protein
MPLLSLLYERAAMIRRNRDAHRPVPGRTSRDSCRPNVNKVHRARDKRQMMSIINQYSFNPQTTVDVTLDELVPCQSSVVSEFRARTLILSATTLHVLL